jgi:isopenicillin N synthase-like dioxygenase
MAEIEVKQDDKFDLGKYPIVDLSSYLTDQGKASVDCRIVVDLLNKFGFLYVKDPRVNDTHNDRFIDMMEKYYSQRDEIKAKDIRKEVSYQVGLTPVRTERARDRCDFIAKLDETEKPLTICPPG